MATREEASARRREYRCLECRGATLFKPCEMLRAKRPQCSRCGSLLLEYAKSCDGGEFKKDGVALPKPRRRRNGFRTPWKELPPEQQTAFRAKAIRNLHEEFKLRRKHGIPLHRPRT
jgi:hypothetical protein